MSKVQALFGTIVPDQVTIEAIEKILETTLEAARRGEVRCLAIVWIDPGDSIHNDWNKGDKYNSQLLGSIANLQHSFQKAWDEV